LRSCKIAFVGSPDSGKSEIIRQFMFDERLSVLDEYVNEQQYLYDTDDNIFATSIEIDGKVFDLRIHDVSMEKDNKQFKLLNVERVAPIVDLQLHFTADLVLHFFHPTLLNKHWTIELLK